MPQYIEIDADGNPMRDIRSLVRCVTRFLRLETLELLMPHHQHFTFTSGETTEINYLQNIAQRTNYTRPKEQLDMILCNLPALSSLAICTYFYHEVEELSWSESVVKEIRSLRQLKHLRSFAYRK